MKSLFNSNKPKTQEHLENSKQSLFRESKKSPKDFVILKRKKRVERRKEETFFFFNTTVLSPESIDVS